MGNGVSATKGNAAVTLRRPSKYRAIKTTVDGITFASKKEARRYGELKLMEFGRLISHLVLQPKFNIRIDGVDICRYVGDFQYWANNDTVIVEDVKGMRKGAAYEMFKLKKRLVKAIYGIEVVEV